MIEVIDQFERTPGFWHPDVMKNPRDFESQLAQIRQAILHISTDPFRVKVTVTGNRLTGIILKVTCSNPYMARRVHEKLSLITTPDLPAIQEADQQELRERYNSDRRVISLSRRIDELDRPGLSSQEQSRLAGLIRILNDLKMREYGDLK